MMRALQALKSGPLSDDPSNRALGRAAGVTPTTIGDWLRGTRFPQAIDPVLVVVGMIREAAEARRITGSGEVPPGLLDDAQWRRAYQAEARRRAGDTSVAVTRAQARAVLTSQDAQGIAAPPPWVSPPAGDAASRDQAGQVPDVPARPLRRGVARFSRRAVTLAGVTLLAVTGGIISAVILASGAHPSSGTGLSVQKSPWTTTASGRTGAVAPGSPIRYAFAVDNSTGASISANIRFEAYWGTQNYKPVNIFEKLFQETIPPGRSTVYSPAAAVPRDALPGAYTEQADIADRNDPADRAGRYGSFDVTGKKLLSIPYLAPSGTPTLGEADGASCVAMVLGSRPGVKQPTARDILEFITGSAQSQGVAGTAGPVAGKDLEYALANYGISEAAISQFTWDEPGLPQTQVTKIAIAVKQGMPVIAFTDGKDLPTGPAGNHSYTGHWLVVVGFAFDRTNGTEVLVNDPDATSGRGGTKDQPIGIRAFEQALADDVSLPVAQQEPDHIAGIIVAPLHNG